MRAMRCLETLDVNPKRSVSEPSLDLDFRMDPNISNYAHGSM